MDPLEERCLRGASKRDERTAHFVNLQLVHPLPSPGVAFELLCIFLPFGKETNLQNGQFTVVELITQNLQFVRDCQYPCEHETRSSHIHLQADAYPGVVSCGVRVIFVDRVGGEGEWPWERA